MGMVVSSEHKHHLDKEDQQYACPIPDPDTDTVVVTEG